jgi:hypothetical protein
MAVGGILTGTGRLQKVPFSKGSGENKKRIYKKGAADPGSTKQALFQEELVKNRNYQGPPKNFYHIVDDTLRHALFKHGKNLSFCSSAEIIQQCVTLTDAEAENPDTTVTQTCLSHNIQVFHTRHQRLQINRLVQHQYHNLEAQFLTDLDQIRTQCVPTDHPPEVYIAYAWGNRAHSAWTRTFEHCLAKTGIMRTHFDKRWDKRGNMTNGKVSSFVDRIKNDGMKVLLICTPTLIRKLRCTAKAPCVPTDSSHKPDHVVKDEMKLIREKFEKDNSAVITILLNGTPDESIPEFLHRHSFTDMRPFLSSRNQVPSHLDAESYYQNFFRIVNKISPEMLTIRAPDYFEALSEKYTPPRQTTV